MRRYQFGNEILTFESDEDAIQYAEDAGATEFKPLDDAPPRRSGAEARARAKKIETGSTPDDILSQGLAFGRDLVGTVGGATAALTENVGRVAGLLPGIDSDNFVSRSGKEARQFYDEVVKSPEMRKQEQAAAQEVEDAKGFVDKFKAGATSLASNPMAAAQFVADQGVNLVPGAGAARGAALLGAGAKGATAASTLAGATMQGGSVAGDTFDTLLELPEENWASLPEYEERVTAGSSPEEAKRAISERYSTIAGGAGALASILFNVKGALGTVERGLAGVVAQPKTAGKAALDAGKSFLAETLISEPGEEGAGLLAKNLTVSNVGPVENVSDLFEGMGETLSQSMIGGAMMGGPAAGLEGVQSFQAGRGQAPKVPPTPPAPKAPEAVDTSVLDRPDPVAERNLAAQAKRRDDDFADVVKADPAAEESVRSWRAQNPSGDVDSFLADLKVQEQEQSAEQAAQTPKVQAAQAKAQEAVAKVEAAQQVVGADPTQAPPPEITAEEARTIQKEGTTKLEKEAQAAQETVRTEIQTVQAQEESSHADDLASKVKEQKTKRSADAKLVFKDLLSGMGKRAVEFNEETLTKAGEAAGVPQESISVRVAQVKKTIADAEATEKAAKERARGGQGENGRQTPAKAPSAPAATSIEEIIAKAGDSFQRAVDAPSDESNEIIDNMEPSGILTREESLRLAKEIAKRRIAAARQDRGSPMGETVTAPALADASTTQTQEGGSNEEVQQAQQEGGQGRQALLNQDAQTLLSIFKEKGRDAAGAEFQRIVKDRGLTQGEGAALSDSFRKAAERDGVDLKKPAATAEGASNAQSQTASGEGAAPERSGGTPLAGEPGGELPQGLGEEAAGRGSDPAPGGAGTPSTGSLRGDDRVAGGVAGDRPSDERSVEGVPPDRLGQDVAHQSTELSPGGNFNAVEEDVGPGQAGGVKQFDQNIEALKVLRLCQQETRKATPEEKRILGRWNGWGSIKRWLYPDGQGFTDADRARFKELSEFVNEKDLEGLQRSTLNAHYTSPEVVDAMWDAVRSLGFTGGTVVDPSMGSGIFFGRMPRDLMDSSKLRGVELERITAGIAGLLYEQADVIQGGYEEQRFAPGSVDLHISNVPFGAFTLRDRETGDKASIHNFFFQKALRATRPGGIVVFITGKGMMDAMAAQAGGPEFRAALQKDARFLGAVRLPNNAFMGSANTKVTTDVVILQKRAEGDSSEDIPWIQRGKIAGRDDQGAPTEFEINQFYQDNPDNVLGEVRPESLYRKAEGASDTGVFPTGRDIPAEIRRILGNLTGVNKPALQDQTAIRTAAMVDRSIAALEATTLPPKSLFEKDRKFYRVLNGGRAEPVEIEAKAAAVLRSVFPIRDAFRALLEAQLSGGDHASARTKLNDAYDAFAKGGKTLHGVKRLLELDEANVASLLALEERKEGKHVKSAIFEKNTQKKAERSEAKNAADALLLSLDERGGVDLPFMVERSGMTEEELLAGLPDKLFRDPQTGGLVLSEVYLSGDVAGKLAVAENAGDKYAANAEALRAALPPEVSAEDVRVRIGASWVGQENVNKFLASIGAGSRAYFNANLGTWTIQAGQDRGFEFSSDGGVNSEFLLQCCLNFKPPVVTIETPDGRKLVDEKRSAGAKIQFDRMQRKFGEWMIEDPDRADFVSKEFNRKLGGYGVPKFDGKHLTFPGMSRLWADRLRDHQRAAIWRILVWGSTVLHHDVGTGKTATMIGAMMELKRTGKANKPMVVVPNHIVNQFGKDAADMYPGARILVLSTAMLGKRVRRTTLARVATGDWDLVVVPHSSFGMLTMSPAKMEKYGQEEIDALTGALRVATSAKDMDGRQRSALEKRIQSLKEKLKKSLDAMKGDPGPFFDELGVDAMAVDEAHEFKNLPNVTKANRIRGVSVGDANRAMDLFMKTRHLSAVTGGRNLIFATGTPITRTIVETHTYLRYLAPGVLKRLGAESLDQFLHQFGAVSSEATLPPGGGNLRIEQQMTWQNVPQLSMAWQQLSDRVSARDTKIVRPEIKGGAPQNVTVPRHPLIGAAMDEISASIEALGKGGKAAKGAPNIMSEMMRARKLGLDWRLLDEDNVDLPESKVNECVRSVIQIHAAETEVKGTQIIWCDLGVPKKNKGPVKVKEPDPEVDEDDEAPNNFNLYQDIKDKLVAGGIPADEIQFIHDHKEEAKKGLLFEKINNGDVRVILASSQLMATGANIQKRLAAMHHLDATWNPSDMEQRNGRGIRQGNIYSERGGVEVRYYSTEKTFDAYFWQTLERKAKVIEAFASGKLADREMEDAGMGAMTAAQAKAEASGNPKMFEYVVVKRRFEELDQAKSLIESSARRAANSIERVQDNLDGMEAQLTLLPAKDFELSDITVGGKKYETSGEIAEAIRARYDEMGRPDVFTLFNLAGNPVSFKAGNIRMPNVPWSRTFGLPSSPGSIDGTGVNVALHRMLPSVHRTMLERDIAQFRRTIEDLKKKATQTFEEQDELNKAQARYLELDAELMGKGANGSSDAESGGIEQPDDGTMLYDLGDLDIKGVRKSSISKPDGLTGVSQQRRIQEFGLESRESVVLQRDWIPTAPIGAATINGQKFVLFRHLGYTKALPLAVYLQMAQKGASFFVSPKVESVGSVNSEGAMAIPLFDDPSLDDYARRLLRMPDAPQIPPGMEALADLTTERIVEAGKKIKGLFVLGMEADEQIVAAVRATQNALSDIESAQALSVELEESVSLLSSGKLDAKTAAAVLRKVRRRTEAAGKTVHRGLAGISQGLSIVAQAELADRIRATGKRFQIPMGYGNYWISQALSSVNEAYGTKLNLYPSKEGAELLLGYAADLFTQATGKTLEAKTVDDFASWMKGEVKLNANKFPDLMVAGMGLLGVYTIHPGTAQYLAAGMVAWGMMHVIKTIWGGGTFLGKKWGGVSFMFAPRTQIAGVVSRNGRGVDGFRILEMLDQAYMRAQEIAGTPSLILKRMRRAAKGDATIGKLLSDFVEGSPIPPELRGLGVNAKAVLDYFTGKMREAEIPVLDDYLPRVYLHEGFEKAMKDPQSRDELVSSLMPKIEEFHPEWVQMRIDDGSSPDKALEDAAVYLLETLEGRSRDEDYGLTKSVSVTLYESGHAKGRKLLFDIPQFVTGSDGKRIDLVERDFFKIMDRYIPQMSRTLAEKEVVSSTEINAWLRGIQGDDRATTRTRMLGHIKNDLSGRIHRVSGIDKTWSERLRNLRIMNSVLYLGLSVWYPVRNFLFATPLAAGLTNIPAAAVGFAKGSLAMPLIVAESLATQPWVKGKARGFMQGVSATMAKAASKVGLSLAQVEMAGAMTQQIFDDTMGRKGQIARAIMAPSLLTQNAVDVWGFYAGRSYFDTLVKKAGKGDPYANQILNEALGAGPVSSGAFTEADRDRVGLYYKMLISGTSRSLNLPAFMGNEIGRTVLQFGSIPMEQTRTLATRILPDPLRSAQFATGATIAGLVMLLKLWFSVKDPEDEREERIRTWFEEAEGWQVFAYIMATSGAPQMFSPGFEFMSGAGRQDLSISELVPMPSISRGTGLLEAGGTSLYKGFKAVGQRESPSDIATVTAMPMVRELVNNQSSLPRSLGVRVGKAPVEEEMSGR